MQHWSWILYALFCLCHVIEDKCWKHSFKQSMKLKCTARKECKKYINESIYLKCSVPKTRYTPCGNMMPLKLTGKIQIVEFCRLTEENGRADINAFRWLHDILEWNTSFIFHPMTCSIFTLCEFACLVCPINANLFLHNEFLVSSFFKETIWFGWFCATRWAQLHWTVQTSHFLCRSLSMVARIWCCVIIPAHRQMLHSLEQPEVCSCRYHHKSPLPSKERSYASYPQAIHDADEKLWMFVALNWAVFYLKRAFSQRCERKIWEFSLGMFELFAEVKVRTHIWNCVAL